MPLAVPGAANGAAAGSRGAVPAIPRPEDLAAELAGWRQRALEAPGPLVVALSASYGAKGGLVGSILAQRLGLPFLDRAIPAAVAAELAVPLDEALAHDDQASPRLGSVLRRHEPGRDPVRRPTPRCQRRRR